MKHEHTGGVSHRWTGDHLLVTTPYGQYTLDAERTMDLLVHLYENRDGILEALHVLPGWARPEPTGTKVSEERQKRLPAPHTVPFVINIDGEQPRN